MRFTLKYVQEELLRIASEHPTTVNNSGVLIGKECRYHHEAGPCIAGQFFEDNGLRVPERFEGLGAGDVIHDAFWTQEWEDDAINLLQVVQMDADSGHPWGEIVARLELR